MAKQQARLEKDWIAAAEDFRQRKLWEVFPSEALFLVRLEESGAFWCASVMGSGGEEYGLGLCAGEAGFHGYVNLIRGDDGDGEFIRACDLSSVVFEPWGHVAEEFRAPVLRAGPAPRREKIVPVAFASPPYEITRGVTRGELRTQLMILRGIVRAADAGTFQPFDLTEVDPAAPTVFELALSGTPKRPEVSTRVVPWPAELRTREPLAMLPARIVEQPRLDECWLIGRARLPAMIEGDDRLTSAFVVLVEGGIVLGTKIGQGDDQRPGVDLFLEACLGARTDGKSAGVPLELLIGDRKLHDALAPAVQALGIRAEYEPHHPQLEFVLEDLTSTLIRSAEHEPDDSPDFEVPVLLLHHAFKDGLPSERALVRYFGSKQLAHERLGSPEEGCLEAFSEWMAADYRATTRSKTLVEKWLAQKTLEPPLREWLEARRHPRFAFLRVDAVEGTTLSGQDLLTGEALRIEDPWLADGDFAHAVLPLRLLVVDGWTRPLLAGPPLALAEISVALNALAPEVTPELLSSRPELLGRLWNFAPDAAAPRLQNHDGDLLDPQRATFGVRDVARLRRSLAGRSDVDRVDGAWRWFRPLDEDPNGRVMLLGTLALRDERLLLDVNSHERLARARTWLEKIPGVRFAGTRSSEGLEELVPAPSSGPPSASDLQRWLADYYRDWLRQPIPALGNLTPHEACKHPGKRRQVEALVRSLPTLPTSNGPVEPPRRELLRELGLEP